MPPCLSHFYVVCPADQKLPVLRALVRRELGSRRTAATLAAAGQGSPPPSNSSSGGGLNADTRALVFAHATKPLEAIAGSLHVALGGKSGQGQGELDSGGKDGEAADAAPSPPLAECLREELGLNKRVRGGEIRGIVCFGG